jgi:uncharacterized protein
MSLISLISQKTNLSTQVVQIIINLLDEGNTVPFIARYRKEMTGGATDEQLRDFHDIYIYTKNLESRKADIMRLIDEKGLLTDELRKQILDATTLAQVEDIYRPFKEKKMSKASIAKAKGLGPLAEILKECMISRKEFELKAEEFIVDTGDVKTSVKSVAEAIKWAQDIVAEEVSDHAWLRDAIRRSTSLTLTTKPTKTFEENGVYKIYGTYSKKLGDMPSYAYLAVSRAEDEKQISVSLDRSLPRLMRETAEFFVPAQASDLVALLEEAMEDGLKRLLIPSLEREFRSDKKRWSDEAAIKLFGENMRQLLLTPPVRGKTVLGFDPGYRTGCKLAVMDPTGKFLAKGVIFPTYGPWAIDGSRDEQTVLDMIMKHGIDLIVIGNGTASRESTQFISNLLKKHKSALDAAKLKVDYMVVSEAGASVYSASALAQKEYPDLDVTIRGAISIGHRVQDAMGELTKIEPKAIGVGQYQHDVDQKLLDQKLHEKVEDTVNSVGVDVNTASATLLQYIAWFSATVASNIVAHRDEHGAFISKAQLKKVKGLGPKAYEQGVGFLRIYGGKEPLDETGIHPEMIEKVYAMLKGEGQGEGKGKVVLPLIRASAQAPWALQLLSKKYDIGLATLQDILKELARPGFDPRDDLEPPRFSSNVMEIKDLEIGMKLEGVVRNITDFGAFVDIGLHNDGLVHKSQMADRFVSHPMDVVSLGQQVTVRVLEIDLDREKVSLSMKNGSSAPAPVAPRPQAPVIIQKEEDDFQSPFGSNISFVQKKK